MEKDYSTDIAASYRNTIAVVDIALICLDTKRLLLGTKEKDDGKMRFFGGFVCPISDKSYEDAAKRELKEETGGNVEAELHSYLGSLRMDDSRYSRDKNRLFTSFYVFQYVFGPAVGSDDIFKVEWHSIEELTEDMFVDVHKPLFKIFMDWLNKNISDVQVKNTNFGEDFVN